jgi:hypothetical protein
MGFETTIPASERAKTVHALDRAATGIAKSNIKFFKSTYGEMQKLFKLHKHKVHRGTANVYKRNFLCRLFYHQSPTFFFVSSARSHFICF